VAVDDAVGLLAVMEKAAIAPECSGRCAHTKARRQAAVLDAGFDWKIQRD
jgi:hypothetical protein